MCTSPNYMEFVGCDSEGKEKFKFHPHSSYDFLLKNGLLNVMFQVPCGKCDECLAQHARHWAERCSLEAKKSKDNYFVTLTYNDNELPPNGLEKKHLQLFLKSLRKKFPGVKIRFFGCGEYGSKTFRPHFHLILFNCPLNDLSEVFYEEKDGRLVAHRNGELDYRCMYSETIHSSWYNNETKQRRGNISVAYFSFATACYVAQYVTKKTSRDLKKFYKMFSCSPEYIVMSRRPGIGADSLDEADYENDCIIVPGDGRAHISSIPRYFDKLTIKAIGEELFNNNVRLSRSEKRKTRYLGYLKDNRSMDLELSHKASRLYRKRKERQSL